MLIVSKGLGNFDGSASFFKLLLGFHGSFLAHTGQNFAAGGFSHGLGFAETEAGQLSDDLNGFDLLGAGILDDDIKFGLFFDGFSSSGRAGSSSDGDRGSGGNAPLGFESLDEISSFQNGKLAQFFYEFF